MFPSIESNVLFSWRMKKTCVILRDAAPPAGTTRVSTAGATAKLAASTAWLLGRVAATSTFCTLPKM